ncbi:GTPase Era [Ponticaulis sp.]|uniref:GTPase Era n=1 Tax=Ponticaulis sp. TaxID=2020902 RepID=UPI000C63A6AE|nr:GTPase Era [Ponticaulis sp.]MAJ08516.1 GTPase Era [Ponticaulis sp.]MDF1681759.1 GTPase Era [Ponticaulis sp.]HBH88780.1 GTPase Era [Hyphomonadaceae bacterium]HBJ93831.1 GTPase Era [Hyphomonadaceae bacterium]|tara:strand:- start:855 stop:1808 length:954 start_codon:yes stop_codon:yes gene_type:complete
MTPETDQTRAGFVAVIGAPNAGKSTLVNRLVGQKVAIVTQKVQTTRFPVRGIAMHNDAQIVLLDTPGIFKTKRRLDRAMVKAALAGAEDADVILHVIDATGWVAEILKRPLTGAQKKSMEDDRRVMQDLKTLGRKGILALNKIDEFDHLEILPVIQKLNEEGIYSEIYPISAANGDGTATLLDHLAGLVPESPYLYDPEQTADLPMRLLASEVTREKLMLRLHQELPYQLMVDTETWEERKDGSVRIQQAIIIGRENHKSMVLGKGGQTIKEIGKRAREELEGMLDRKVHLFLFVKVDERWMEKRDFYTPLGLDFDV